jgi:hypothetical protein
MATKQVIRGVELANADDALIASILFNLTLVGILCLGSAAFGRTFIKHTWPLGMIVQGIALIGLVGKFSEHKERAMYLAGDEQEVR